MNAHINFDLPQALLAVISDREFDDVELIRREGPLALQTRLAALERLCQERVADLNRPGQVLLELSRNGFGVLLD